jgi:hypothetical protein
MVETPLLISVHIPKTAGTSFGAALEAHFGARLTHHYRREAGIDSKYLLLRRASRLVWAFGRGVADAMQTARFREIDCIHGHFPGIRFMALLCRRQVSFITWLRDPVERIVSNYHHIYRMQPRQSVHPPIWDTIVEERWSLEKFALSENFRNRASHILWGIPLRLFSFVGITEHYEEDLAWFANNVLKADAPALRMNVNHDKTEPRYPLQAELRHRIETFHAADVALYSRALALRQLRRP